MFIINVLDCICQRSSRSAFPFSDVHLPGSQSCVWRVSTVYQSPCLCSVGFLNESDQASYTASRYQSQCIIHLHATLQVCFSKSSHCCQGDRSPLDFTSVHQRVRNRTDEAHVYSEAEFKVLVLCIVSIERRRLAKASQVFEQLCIQRFGSGGHDRSHFPQRLRRSEISVNRQSQRRLAPQPCTKSR